MIKKIFVGSLASIGIVYVLCSIVAWKTGGMQDYVKVHRQDRAKL